MNRLELEAAIQRGLSDLWADYRPAEGIYGRLEGWMTEYDPNDLITILRLVSDSHVGQKVPPKGFWVEVRRMMDERFGWMGRGEQNEYGHSPAEIKNICREHRRVRQPPLPQPPQFVHDMSDQELYNLHVRQEYPDPKGGKARSYMGRNGEHVGKSAVHQHSENDVDQGHRLAVGK